MLTNAKNALTVYLILLKILTEIIYNRFYTVCKTLNQNLEGFYKFEKHCFIHSSVNSLISFIFYLTLYKQVS